MCIQGFDSGPVTFLERIREGDTHCSDAAAEAFAALNHWRACESFTLRQLAASNWKHETNGRLPFFTCLDVLDHPLFFRQGRWPVAIVGQPYNPESPYVRDDIARITSVLDLKVHRPPAEFASFHYPGACAFLVFTRLGQHVEWLPEQQDEFGTFAVRESDHE